LSIDPENYMRTSRHIQTIGQNLHPAPINQGRVKLDRLTRHRNSYTTIYESRNLTMTMNDDSQCTLLKTILLLENIICVINYRKHSRCNHFLLHRRIRRNLSISAYSPKPQSTTHSIPRTNTKKCRRWGREGQRGTLSG